MSQLFARKCRGRLVYIKCMGPLTDENCKKAYECGIELTLPWDKIPKPEDTLWGGDKTLKNDQTLMERSTWMRTFAVALGGVVLSFVAPLLLARVFLPGEFTLISKAFVIPPHSSQWTEVSYQLHRAELIQAYVINPLGGVVVGIFVGLLQQRRALIAAVGCMIPDLLYGLLVSRPRIWADSVRGVL